jgi:sugar lactone lactonase YvrE
MAISFVFQRVINCLFIASFITVITACGGGGGSSLTNPPASSASVASSSSSSAISLAVNDGIGAAAKFSNPAYVVRVGDNLYATEQINNTVRKIVIATGAVTTFAGAAGVNGSIDGTGAAARFTTPNGITSDGTNLYVVDSGNHTIRKIVIATGVVTTIAGTAGRADNNDGARAIASFFFPTSIATDGTHLYVTSGMAIRKVDITTGAVSTLAGTGFMSGSIDGIGTAARFYNPNDIASDGTNLYVTDSFNNTIRKIVIATGAVTTFAGTALMFGSKDDTGTAATFNSPVGITTDGTNLYVTDSTSKTIRQINITTASVTTLAGKVFALGSADGIGAAASFNTPHGITTDGTNLYVADIFNNTIRKIVISTAAVTTLAGTAGVNGRVN